MAYMETVSVPPDSTTGRLTFDISLLDVCEALQDYEDLETELKSITR